MLVSGIQQGDAAFYLGALGTIALGSMVYMMKQKLSGRDIDYSWNNLVKEGSTGVECLAGSLSR